MTREELKQKAEENAKKRTKGFKCQENCEKSYVMGALDFAEPRENRIAELEEQNANLIAMLKSEREVRVNDDYLKGICEKEAEIGKLEDKVQDWTSEYYELENLMNNKVAKAKEIIKGLLGLKSTISSAQDAENRFSVRKKAEEFLGKEE